MAISLIQSKRGVARYIFLMSNNLKFDGLQLYKNIYKATAIHESKIDLIEANVGTTVMKTPQPSLHH